MRPIPSKLLCHKVTAVELSQPDMWNKQSEQGRTELSRVRLEPSSKLRIDKQNKQIQLSAILFFDCNNSRPKGYDFSHVAKIEIGDKKYDVVNIKKLYDETGKIHHMEVELCL